MKPQNSLAITILDKEYRVACEPDEQETLQAAVDALNKRLRDIKKKGSVIGTERIAIMAALNMSHEVLSGKVMEDENRILNERLGGLSDKIEAAMRDIRL